MSSYKTRVLTTILIFLMAFSIMLSYGPSDNAIIRKAYYSLRDGDRRSVIDWKTAQVEDYSDEHTHTIVNPVTSKHIEIKNMDAYMVTFTTYYFPSSLSVYIDKRSMKVLGWDVIK